MNASRPLFPAAVRTAQWLAAVSGCALLAGCIGNPLADAKIDPASPVAADVARMTRQGTDYPSFSEIPAAPKDIRPLALYGRQANDIKRAGDQLIAETAPHTWTLQGTEAFAEEARRRTPDLPPPNPEDAEAFARELRERATPPPRR